MINRLKITLAISIIALTALSCNLPTRSTGTAPSMTVESTPVSKAAAPAGESDYSSARLQVEDLPSGFRELTEEELQSLGLSSSQFTQAFNGMLSSAQAQNFAAFINTGSSFEVIVSVLMAPVTTLEGATIDLLMQNPDRLADELTADSGLSDFTIDESATLIGNSSTSATFSMPDSALEMKGNITVSRRGKALQIALQFHPAGVQPAINAHTVAEIVDAKLAALE